MARKTIVTLVDDLTGEEAQDISTVEFAVDGTTYELDLTNDNSAKLRGDGLSPVCQSRSKNWRSTPRRYPPKPNPQKRQQRRRLHPRDAEIDPCVGQGKRSQRQRPRPTVRRGVAGLADRPGGDVPRIGHALSPGRLK